MKSARCQLEKKQQTHEISVDLSQWDRLICLHQFFIADVQISNEKLNGMIQQNKRDIRTEKKETKHYPDFKSI